MVNKKACLGVPPQQPVVEGYLAGHQQHNLLKVAYLVGHLLLSPHQVASLADSHRVKQVEAYLDRADNQHLKEEVYSEVELKLSKHLPFLVVLNLLLLLQPLLFLVRQISSNNQVPAFFQARHKILAFLEVSHSRLAYLVAGINNSSR